MKPIVGRALRYLQFILIFLVVTSVGVLMGQQGLTEKDVLEKKRASLTKENDSLARKIKLLERDVTLLRSDDKTIARVAKRKLGMARPDETVYIFDRQKVRGRAPALGSASDN